MNNIVIITTRGNTKRMFVNVLHKETQGAIALVIIQKPQRKSILRRVQGLVKKVSPRYIVSEIYYYSVMRWCKGYRDAILFPKLISIQDDTIGYLPPVLEVDDVNSEEVTREIDRIQPSIIALWGGKIVKPHIFSLAKHTLNLHTGFCPYYRGTNCNLHALLRNDFAHIGITIHEVVAEVDAGRIFTIVTADTRNSPRQFFTELNDKAFRAYIKIIRALWRGEQITTQQQDITQGHNYLLKDWTYAHQYKVARFLRALERGRE